MAIINRINCNIISFQGLNKLSGNKQSINSDILKSYVAKAVGYFRKDGERLIPENGKFAPITAYLEVKGRPNTARLAVEYDPLDPKAKRLINIGVFRNNTDKIFQRHPKSGTKKEIVDYLKGENALDDIYKHIVELSEKVDNQ